MQLTVDVVAAVGQRYPKVRKDNKCRFFIYLFLQTTSLDSCIRLLYKIVFYSKMLSRAADERSGMQMNMHVGATAPTDNLIDELACRLQQRYS